MEQGRKTPPEVIAASIDKFFGIESKKISNRMQRVTSLAKGVDTNGSVVRKQQQILHLEERKTELDHVHSFVSRILADITQTSEIPSIRYYFVGKIDEIDLEAKRIQSDPRGVIFENGIVKGIKQEQHHLAIIRADMLRVGNHVLDLLGQPPLVDEKTPTTI